MSGCVSPRATGLPYGLTLDLTARRVLVVGGGPSAADRAAELVEAGAAVLVVAPVLCDALVELVDAELVRWRAREFRAGDLDGVWLVHAASGDPVVDEAVALLAESARLWCVRDDGRARTALPSVAPAVSPAQSAVAVSPTDRPSAAPVPGSALSRGSVRSVPSGRHAVAAELSVLSGGRSRVPAGERAVGVVHLVGGGPGDPELLTVRGRRLLATADVVVVDRLAPRGVLAELSPDVEVIDCGKAPGRHALTQEEINALLVERAARGLTVVRLKGGDPFVLGRGGEEALACRAAGVPVTVVPGVTSAVAVPAAAGIPVTHRAVASSFAVLSAHEGVGGVVDAARCHAQTATLVLLMGVRQLAASAAALIGTGRAATTPVAVVERGWLPGQRVTVGTLADIAERARTREVRSPAVVVVGDVVALRAGIGDVVGESEVAALSAGVVAGGLSGAARADRSAPSLVG